MDNKNYEITEVESERINILKVWLIIMVVFIHTYNGTINFNSGSIILNTPEWFEMIKYIISEIISSCAVQTFFFISAILLYRKPFLWKENIKKKIRTLLIPYILLNTLWIMFYIICTNISGVKEFFSNSNTNINQWELGDWINAYTGYKTSFPILYPLWFIRDLFVLNIFSIIIKKIVDKFPKISFTISMIMWLFLDSTKIFCLDTTTICFWIFGCCLVRKGIKLNSIDKIKKRYISIVYILVVLIEILTLKYSINKIIHRITILVGLIFWFACTTNLKNGRFKNIIIFISSYTFSIYLFHEMSLTIMKKIYIKLFEGNLLLQSLEYFIIPCSIISICIIFSIILQKKLPRIYSIITGNRVKKVN